MVTLPSIRSASSWSGTYGYESVFKGGASVLDLFGKEVKINALQFTNNSQGLGNLNTPQITDFLYNSNRGSCSVDYILSNPWVFTGVLNVWYSKSGGGPYTYIWTSDPSLNTNAMVPLSIHLQIAGRYGTGIVRNPKGVLCTSMTLKCSVDNPVAVTQSLVWGHEDAISTSIPGSLPSDSSFSPHNFVNAAVQLPDSTPLADVQDWNLTIDNGYTLLPAMNSADAQDMYSKIFNLTGSIKVALRDVTIFNDVVNRGPVASLSFTISDASNTIKILLEQVSIFSDTWDGLQPAELVTSEFQYQAQKITVTATTTTTDPADPL